MKYPQLNQMRSQLLSAGYSPAYISRLCGELDDHYQSVMEERENGWQSTNQHAGDDLALQRIGTSDEVVAAVVQTPELTPLVRRYPLVAFVLVPGIFLCFFTWSIVTLAYFLAQAKTEFLGRELLVNGFEIASSTLLAIFTAGFVGLAIRFKCRLIFPLFATGIISMCGFYKVDVAGCVASGGTFFGSDWGFSTWNFVAPWLGLAIVLGLTMWQRSWRPSTGTGSADQAKESNALTPKPLRAHSALPMPVSIAICFAATIIAFYVFVERVRISTLIHPADNIVASYNEPGTLTSLKLELLANEEVLEQLQVQPKKVRRTRRVLDHFDAETKKIATLWRADHQNSSRMMKTAHFIEPIERASAKVDEMLTDEQRARLEQMAYASLGWNIVFREEVCDGLRISSRQSNQLKDILSNRIRQSHELDLVFGKASPPERDRIVANKRALQKHFDNEMMNVLSKKQLVQLNAICGTRISQ